MTRSRQRQVVVALLCCVVAVIASNAFDQMLWHVIVATGLVSLVAIASARLAGAWRACVLGVSIVAMTVAAVFVEGGDTGESIDVWTFGPRRLLTTEWPSPTVPTTVGAVVAFVTLIGAISTDLAGRTRLHLTPLAVVLIGWVAALSIGAPERPSIGWMVLAAALAALFALMRPDAGGGPAETIVSDRTIVASVVALVVVGVGSATAIAWSDRADPRRTLDAELNAAVLDPIEEMVALRRADPPLSLFRITDRSRLVGDSLPARWRLGALDTYDGQRWVPELSLRPIGGRLSTAEPSAFDRTPVSYALEFLADDFDLLPLPGSPIAVNSDVQTDEGRVVVQLAERPSIGDQVVIESEVALTSRSALAGDVALRPVDELAGEFSEQANRMAGDGTVQEQVRQLETHMRERWSLDSAAPGGGQQFALLERFITDTQRGTNEQFVTAFVLMARALGVNTRVATGFVVPPEDISAPLNLTSEMATVWPEVEFVDEGWVAFDPVPEVEEADEDEPQTPPEAQTPAAVQPPIAPPSDEADEIDETTIDVTSDEARWSTVRRWVTRVAAVSSLTLLPFVLVISSILGLKWWRRRRRIVGVTAAAKVHGIWANTTDALVDAGMAIAPSWTDDHIALEGAALAPSVPHELRRLAAMSSHVTFGAPSAVEGMADDAGATAGAVNAAIRSHRTRWERIRWRLSLRSLRRTTRSPVG